jgi:uncharacterized protein YraI
MKSLLNLLVAVFMLSLLASSSTLAANALTTTSANVRAGPDNRYPLVATLPVGARVTIHGCVRKRRWCDTSWRGVRGWVAARFLETF